MFADDLIVTAPPAVIARPSWIHASDRVNAILIETAAATLTDPSDEEAEPPPLVPLPVPPLLVEVSLPNERCCETRPSMPPDGAPSLPSPGAPAALADESLAVSDEPSARMLTASPAVTLRSVQA